MDSNSLMALFRKIALASAPLLGGGCESYVCNNPIMEQTIALDPADAGIADGGTSDGGIDDLCRRALAPSTVYIRNCEIVSSDGGQAVHVVYSSYCVGGRRPAQWAAPAMRGRPGALAAWLSGTAHMEAVSVGAFSMLAAELKAHGAPPTMVSAARAAIQDERRHARVMGRLAVRRGGRAPAARSVRPGQPADLEAVAKQNAVEGCVRETFAAAVACRQAEAARDVEVRDAMKVIAIEETRHAALSFAIHEWARTRLSRAARARVRAARQEAGEALIAELASPETEELRQAVGLPDAAEAVRMAGALRARVWG
jgi:hypothetical protein